MRIDSVSKLSEQYFQFLLRGGHIKKFILGTIAIVATFLVSDCEAPQHTKVRRGLDPENQDTDVRFRTKYYFRIFDACARPSVGESTKSFGIQAPFAEAPGQNARIITDSLYRFRMTGKANALANKIRFESGTLRKEEIDPFGATISFKQTAGQPRFRSRAATEALARREDAERNLEKLLRIYTNIEDQIGGKDGKSNPEAVKAMRETVQKQIQGELAALVTPAGNQAARELSGTGNVFSRLADSSRVLVEEVNATAADIKAKSDAASSAADPAAPAGGGQKPSVKPADVVKQLQELPKLLAKLRVNRDGAHKALQGLAKTLRAGDDVLITDALKVLKDEKLDPLSVVDPTNFDIAQAKKGADEAKKIAEKAAKVADAATKTLNTLERNLNRQLSGSGTQSCGAGSELRRGFQVLGPEGWKTFDQDERLIMAMTSSAKPLIGTLQQLSSQVLKQEANSSDQLLPLVKEQLRISEAQRALLRVEPLQFNSASVDDLKKILEGGQ